jgi:hypothetical protein
MSPFEALLRSLLEQCVDYIRGDIDLEALRVTGDALSESAHVEIVLGKDTWEEQQVAIDHMVDIRSMFLGDLALSYSFLRHDEWQRVYEDSDEAALVFAA